MTKELNKALDNFIKVTEAQTKHNEQVSKNVENLALRVEQLLTNTENLSKYVDQVNERVERLEDKTDLKVVSVHKRLNNLEIGLSRVRIWLGSFALSFGAISIIVYFTVIRPFLNFFTFHDGLTAGF